LQDFHKRTARLLPDSKSGPVLELVRGAAGEVRAFFNLSDQPQPLPSGPADGQQVLFSSESARYGGHRQDNHPVERLLPAECVVFGSAD
jgi:hypothetical protein